MAEAKYVPRDLPITIVLILEISPLEQVDLNASIMTEAS